MIIIDERKDDSKAFIFTLKNAHGVEPTRFMKRKERIDAIYCDPEYGPIFGNIMNYEINIGNNFINKDCCWIWNDGERGYDCHPQYKSSLYVNTAGSEKENRFSVLDYEVFTYNITSIKYSPFWIRWLRGM